MCTHVPPCPAAADGNRGEARPVASHSDQGCNLLCNSVIPFEDGGELLPDRAGIAPLAKAGPDTRQADER
ncbi:DUF5999 family protein [Streptomyces lavendulae]|uniref:DUF5999 family protein n=1 Tax=Streptomyces lavendulae TaxID=1914 RepID=UPI00340F6E52